jgi:hypothetical protein
LRAIGLAFGGGMSPAAFSARTDQGKRPVTPGFEVVLGRYGVAAAATAHRQDCLGH